MILGHHSVAVKHAGITRRVSRWHPGTFEFRPAGREISSLHKESVYILAGSYHQIFAESFFSEESLLELEGKSQEMA